MQKQNFKTFKYRCVHNIKSIIIEKIEEVNLANTLGYIKFKSQIYGSNEKFRNAQEKGFKLDEIVKLTIENDSSVSNKNMFFLNYLCQHVHREFLRSISQKQEYLKNVCIDRNNPFHFACRR